MSERRERQFQSKSTGDNLMSEFTTKNYMDALAEGNIRGSKCNTCGSIHVPPRPICPNCGGINLEWKNVSQKGEIQAFTMIQVPLSNMVGRSPYAVAVVKLNNGPSISGLVLDVEDSEELSVGAQVVAEFISEGEKTSLCFKLI